MRKIRVKNFFPVGSPSEARVLKIDATPECLAKCLVTPIKKPK